MNGEFFDILLFAMIAAFLVLRLRSVLGKRTGNERRPTDPFDSRTRPDPATPDNVVALPERGKSAATVDTPLAATLTQIKLADRRFDEAEFLSGARAAFEMIVNAFASGDRDTLRPLTSEEVFVFFDRAIRDREAVGESFDSTLVGVKSIDIVDARLEAREAQVVVRVVSEQINVTRSAAGDVVSGRTDAVEQVTDVWTFARDTRSSDPNWFLVATESPT